MKRDLQLLIIDPQNDFCDLPPDYLPAGSAPALPVAGAHQDMRRLAGLIDAGRGGLAGITVTIDSHQRIDIAHTVFWADGEGRPVPPFTEVSADDVRAGRYLPRDPQALARTLAYLDALEAAGRYRLMVWPVHCEIGSWGQNVHADVRAAYNRWEETMLRSVNKVSKGANPWTEHYSAVQAEVPDPDDPDTLLNRRLIAALERADRLYIAGEAASHCVRASTEHIVENFSPQNLSKLVLLADCMSPVAGFDAQYRQFVEQMRARGVRIASSAEVLPELLENSRL